MNNPAMNRGTMGNPALSPSPLSPELGSFVHFEHVNLRVSDHRLATYYFIEGLGLTRDPYRNVGTSNMWVNVGLQQFHLPYGEPSPMPGEVGLVVPNLDEARRQLQEVTPALEGTRFTCAQEGETLLTTTPWGHRIRVHPQGLLPGRLPVAIGYVEFWVPPGTAGGIGAFYQQVLGCPVEWRSYQGDKAALVTAGPSQLFRFRERSDGQTHVGLNHVAVYLTQFVRIYNDLKKRDLIMEEHCNEQFRFCNIADPDSGRLLFVFEHEMRSVYHREFRRPLANRVPVPWPVD